VCDPTLSGDPMVNLTEGTRPIATSSIGNLTNFTGRTIELEFNVSISHRCCCSDATASCRSGYESHIALQRDRAQCDAYNAAEFEWIGFFGVATFVMVLFFERRAMEWWVSHQPLSLVEIAQFYLIFVYKFESRLIHLEFVVNHSNKSKIF
jgi:hypothetical protein